MPFTCMPTKSRAMGVETRIGLGEAIALSVELVQHLVDDILGHIRKHVVGEQERHAQDRLHADILAEYLRCIDLHGGEVRRGQLLDLIRTRVDHPDIQAQLCLAPVGRKRPAGGRIADSADDRAGLKRVALGRLADLDVFELVAERLVDAL